MAEELTNATEMAEGEEIRSATKKRFFDVSFKLKVLSRCHSKIGPPADLVRGDRSPASHTLLAKNKAEGSGDRAYNVSFHSPCIGGETYLMCTCFCEGFRL